MRRLIAQLASNCEVSQSGAEISLIHRSFLPILSIASSFYRFSIFIRRELYRWGLLRVNRLPVKVISVGNLTWGGNGKTPMAELLARIYLDAGVVPLVLSRGYAGGDESTMLQRHLQNTPARIGIGANRTKVAASILEKYGFNVDDPCRERRSGDSGIGVIILDDGFQHWSLARDLDIVMINGLMPWGNENMVPRGILREPVDALKRANICVIHHANLVPDVQLKYLEATLLNIKQSLSVFYSWLAPQHFFDIRDVRTNIPLSTVENMVVLCVSAIGFPDAFIRGIKKIGPLHVDWVDFLDHHFLQKEDVLLIKERLRKLEDKFGTKPVAVLTEKDYFRDPEILKEIQEFRVLVICSSLEIISSGGRTLDMFKSILFDLARK
ncbi:tetraacyldisaccharide 4'-kinase family protein [Wolffia australiana]